MLVAEEGGVVVPGASGPGGSESGGTGGYGAARRAQMALLREMRRGPLLKLYIETHCSLPFSIITFIPSLQGILAFLLRK